MKQIERALLSLLLLLMAGLPVLADEHVNETKQGAIRGRVVDNAKQTLPGATIYIESLHTGVVSDMNGFYTLANLAPGTYRVKVSYVGYSPVELTITIPEGKTVLHRTAARLGFAEERDGHHQRRLGRPGGQVPGL